MNKLVDFSLDICISIKKLYARYEEEVKCCNNPLAQIGRRIGEIMLFEYDYLLA